MATFTQISAFLKQKNIPFETVALNDRALTVEDVMKFAKTDPARPLKAEEICKTIIVQTPQRFLALLLRGTDKIDFKRLRKLFGKTQMAKPEEIKKVAGVEIGAVCPVQLGIKILVDTEVTKLPRINLGSGDHRKGIIMKTTDLLKVIDHEVLNIRKT